MHSITVYMVIFNTIHGGIKSQKPNERKTKQLT